MSYLVVLVAVLTRFIPHMPNLSPMFGALLFGGAYLKRRDAIWYPVALLAVSDVVLTRVVYGMRLGWGQSITWLGFAVVALIGYWLRKHKTVGTIGAASLVGPTAFFVISNFGVWLEWRMYPPTLNGLVACYVAAFPFYQNSLLASAAYTGLLFGAYELYRRRQVGLTTTAHAS